MINKCKRMKLTHLNFGNSQKTHSDASSIRTSRCVEAKSSLLPATTIGMSCASLFIWKYGKWKKFHHQGKKAHTRVNVIIMHTCAAQVRCRFCVCVWVEIDCGSHTQNGSNSHAFNWWSMYAWNRFHYGLALP